MKINEDPAAKVVVDAENPWPGLDFFAEKSRAFFHGREAESDLLLTMVRHRLLTVLYGQSGLGKSSLLQAGLFPRLREDGWLPVYIRLSHTDADGLGGKGATALVAQTRQFIREAIADAIEQQQLLPTETNGPSPMPRDDESLWEYLHRKVSGLRSPTRERVAPVLVFDQFEEIFTLGRSETRQAIRETFLRDLANCVENRLPEHVLEEMNRKQRGGASQFGDLDFARQDYRVVLSLREDYLAELHDLSDLMPSIHENETRLVPLNGWQALDAVAIPGEALVEPVVAREIVEIVAASRRGEVNGATTDADDSELTDETKLEVDPALLSMVCRGLNDERKRRRVPRITQEITNDLLKGGGRSILHRFYTECFQSLPDRKSAPEVQKFVEDDLLTPTGYRNMAELVRAQNRLANSGVPDASAAIQRLIDERLLRISERRQDKTKWLELTHDVLCDVVKESRQTREVREAKEREEREEQERAARRLAEAERQRAEAESQARVAREREAEANTRLKQMRRERRLGITALVLTICFAGALVLAGILAFGKFRTGAEAQTRSRTSFAYAQKKLARSDDDRRNVYALRSLARALRSDPGNRNAAKLVCQLLVEKNWCVPLSQPLHYPESLLVSVGISPDNREIVAVAQDGNLVRWRADNFEKLTSLPLLPDKSKGPNKLASAAFSRDGRRILVTMGNRENARVCNWSDHDAAYRPSVATVEFKETVRSLSWSHDGDLLFVFPMRMDQTICRVFTLDGRSFRERPPIPNATAADLSPDDKWLAIAEPGGRVQLWDPRTLQPAPPTPELKTTLEPAEANPETRYFSLVFSSDGQELAATAMMEPARLWNLRDGTIKLLKPRSSRDQIRRFAFAPGNGKDRTIAVAMNGMVQLWNAPQLDQMRSEPICVPDAFVFPTFSSDGKTMLTLSGSFWNSMDTVRAWDVSFSRPALDASKLRFTGKNPPVWLAELADAITGLRVVSEDDETPTLVLSELRKKYAGTSMPEEYKPVWDRFFANAGQ
jgi:conflict system STAND superfamily ATPase